MSGGKPSAKALAAARHLEWLCASIRGSYVLHALGEGWLPSWDAMYGVTLAHRSGLWLRIDPGPWERLCNAPDSSKSVADQLGKLLQEGVVGRHELIETTRGVEVHRVR